MTKNKSEKKKAIIVLHEIYGVNKGTMPEV